MWFLVFALCSALIYFLIILLLRLGLSCLHPCFETKLILVTIIVAMRNEFKNVRLCLEALINQNYPTDLLEIIIVDDGSSDGTSEILADYQKKYFYLKILQSDFKSTDLSRKKVALGQAISNSSGEIILFTDADCVPPPNWIRSMLACFEADVGLVVGFSPIIDPTNSLMGKLLLLDSIANGIAAAGTIGLGGAITCSGRNMGYRREVYNELNGFNKIMHSVSGDDDLFLQLVHKETEWKIKFSPDEDSFVPAYQTKTLKKFFTQKRRHLSAGKYYNFKLQAAYFLFHLSNLFLCAFFLVSMILGQNIFFAILLLISKLLIDWLLFIAAGKDFNVRIKFKYFLIWELFFIGYHLVIAPTSWFGKVKWK